MPTATPRKIRIFVSSPMDVDEERRRMMEVIAVLNRRYVGVVELEGVFWEQTVYPAHATFQAQIDEPSSCNLVVCILWSRLGSPLPAGWPARPDPDGTPYESGTVYEFETALAARRAGVVPDIYVFRKLLPEDRTALDQLMESHPAEKLRILDYLIRRGSADSRAGIELLENFWARWFYSPDKGFIAAFNTFTTADDFNELAHKAIEDWLIGKGVVARLPDWDIGLLGSPYPGLAPFDGARAAVFFGRERVTERALALFRGAAEASFPWLLVTGPSGGGKSSLLRAGVVPALTEETVLGTWRVAVVRPGSEDPLAALLGAVAGVEVLGPDLADGDYPTAADLIRIAKLAPGELVRPLLRALDRRAETVRARLARNSAPSSRLLLVIDQLEEVLLASTERQAEFGNVLSALLAGGNGRIWVTASLRSDLQEPFLKIPSFQPLLTLDRGGRELKLAAPGPADMREVIEKPAARAGLTFEVRDSDGKSLAEELAAAVGTAADALPLLQMTLALLFDRRNPANKQLRWSDYTEMGGLDGAIANQAEAVLRNLPGPVVDELGPLLRQLTRLWLSLDGEIELRPAELYENRLSGRRAELASALVIGRVVVADQGKLRIVHEAVLRNWDRARGLLAADLDLARLKARLEPLVADWVAAGRDPNDAARMLPAGAQLGAADAAAKRYAVEEIGEELAAFIAASVEFERRQRTRRQRILTTAAAAFAGLAVLAIAGGIFAWEERGVATAALDISEQNYRLAITQAAGSVRSLADSYEAGGVSTVLMRELIDKAQATVANLPKGGDDVVVAQTKLLGVLTIGNMTLGNIPAARQYADQERALADGLVAKDPTNVEWRRLWAGARAHSAEVMFWQGDLLKAVELTRPAIDAAARLAAADPTNDDLQTDLIRLYQNLGDNLRQNGDVEEADKAYHAWLAAAEAESAREPDDPGWQRFLAFAHQRLADDLIIMDKPAEAAEQYAVMAGIGSKLAARDPGNGLYIEAASLGQLRLADTHLMQGQLEEAEVGFREALVESSALLEIDPTNYRWRTVVEVAHLMLGQTALRRSDFATADSEIATYLKMAEETLRKDRANNWPLFDVAEAQLEVGDALREEGKLDQALYRYHQSLALVEELTKRLSTNPAWQKLLAAAHQRLGLILEAQGSREDAMAQFRACGAIPVRPTIWSPRLRWPKDIDRYCWDQLNRLGG
jgi:tetratricopeptide (TPR) repeat protein